MNPPFGAAGVCRYKIPVEKRDLACPKRVGVILDYTKLSPPMRLPAI